MLNNKNLGNKTDAESSAAKFQTHSLSGPLRLRSLEEICNWKLPPREYLLPYALPVAETVCVAVSPGVPGHFFGHLSAYVCAAGKSLKPLGKAVPSKVLYCSGSGNKYADQKRFQLLFSRDTDEASKDLARNNLMIYHRHYEEDEPVWLNSTHDQNRFFNSIPPDTRLVIIDNIDSWLRLESEMDVFEKGNLDRFISKLNAAGMTVMIFKFETKKAVKHADVLPHGRHPYVISLTEDKCAPREFGGGFTVQRTRVDDEDPAPTRFQLWYKIVNGNLDFGWECREPDDQATAKHIEITERRMKVEKLLAEGMLQKEIAEELKVDAATISRDVANLKANASKSGERTTEI